jgi:hypothetical protein
MVTQDDNVDELHLVYKVVLSVRDDLNAKFDDLSKQIAAFKEYMIRTQALEIDRNLPARIEAHDKRLEIVERELEGQIKQLKAIVALLTLVSLILGIWLAVVQLTGGK